MMSDLCGSPLLSIVFSSVKSKLVYFCCCLNFVGNDIHENKKRGEFEGRGAMLLLTISLLA
jgi:hypothetical protein